MSATQWSIEISRVSRAICPHTMTFSIEKSRMTYIDCIAKSESSFHMHGKKERKTLFHFRFFIVPGTCIRQVVFTYHLPSRNKCMVELFANFSKHQFFYPSLMGLIGIMLYIFFHTYFENGRLKIGHFWEIFFLSFLAQIPC